MSINKLREIAYRYSVHISGILATVIVLAAYFLKLVPAKLEDKPTIISISVTLAGFLFTGQGIMLALPVDNEFMQSVKRYGYLHDFHKLCRVSELAFMVSVLFGLEIFTKLFLSSILYNALFLISFLWPLIMALWALGIFGAIIELNRL